MQRLYSSGARATFRASSRELDEPISGCQQRKKSCKFAAALADGLGLGLASLQTGYTTTRQWCPRFIERLHNRNVRGETRDLDLTNRRVRTMKSQGMPAARLETVDVSELDRIERWRHEELERAGYDA